MRVSRTWCVSVSILLTLPAAAASQSQGAGGESDRPVVGAARATAAIAIDGLLDEAEWAKALPVSDFTQVDPEEGRPASERTEARVLFDDDALYVGVRLFDREPVSARLGRRDMALSDSDWLGVVIDSYHDHRTGYSFDVNPAGVQRDAVKSMGPGGREQDDLSWDPVWQAAVTTDEDGWTAEYRIPFSQLRFGDAVEPVWGIQIERVIGRRREYSILSFTPKNEQGGIPTFGHLTGLEDLDPGQRLEVLPYVVARAEYVDPGSNPFRTDSEYFRSGGVDLQYRVTSDFTVNATINPDFGQVEVDPAVINLTVYETRFDEKRPFFIEGSEIFDFGRNTSGGQLFYSRRIGRTPQVGAPYPRADMPSATSILGAGKLSGKTGGGWSVGIMEAITSEETVRFIDMADAEGEAIAEPLANYLVGRIRKDGRDGQSSIGGMVTAVNRRLGADYLRESLRENAYAGGIDFRHEWANRSWVVRGSAVGSRISGEPAALQRIQRAGNHFFQRPDADHLDLDPNATNLTGYSVGMAVGKQAGEHWRGELALAATSPGYEVNDLGFQTRTDRRDAALNLSYSENQPGSFFRSYSFSGNVRYEHNYSNQRILGFWIGGFNFRHLNFWGGRLGVQYFPRALDDRSTRGGPMMERPSVLTGTASFMSDARKSVFYGAGVNITRGDYDNWATDLSGSIGIKTSPRWTLTMSPGLLRSYTDAQYVGTLADAAAVDTYGAYYLFAPLRQTTFVLETRLDVTFTSKLSFQLYAQPFISSGDFGAPKSLAAPESYEFDTWLGPASDLDFNFRSLRGTAVLRWEWRPGSTLYLAWQQSRTDYAAGVGDFDFSRDRQALFAADADNVFVLKMNYWLTP